MAAVYRGRDLRLDREVAIKVLREELTRDPGFLQRFKREAQLVASLSHPNIVPVYDVGEEGGTHFIVMEYIKGRTLREAIEIGGPLQPGRACAIACQVLQALAFAHDSGIIHRDVKPHNILLTPDGTARLADFGIAHLADGSTTRTAAILGSAHYLSPEQSAGEEATVRSDLYAAGIVLYEMLSGEPPFNGSNALAIAHMHLHAPPPPLHRSVAPEALSHVLAQALAKAPDERFPDAQAFIRALRAAEPETGATAVQPLAGGGHATSVQPLAGRSGTSVQPPAPAEREERTVAPRAESRLEIRRSARKVVIAGILLSLLVAVLAYMLGAPGVGTRLPNYPSPEYGLAPIALLVLLALAWKNARSWLYTMDGNAAVVHWGLFGHHRFGVPVRYITTLELKQSPIDRVLRIGTVELTARDQHGRERHVVLEDLAHPRQTYEALMEHLAQTSRRGG